MSTKEEYQVDLVGNNDKYDRSITESDRKTGTFERRLQSTSKRLKAFGDRAVAFGNQMSRISAGFVVAGGAAFAMAKATADNGNRIDKMARAAGVSSTALQEVSFALGQVSEMSDEQVGKALNRLTRSMGDAAEGVKLPLDAFAKLGVTQEELQSGALTTEDVFERLLVALQNTASPAEAAALAASLMGREGAVLGPILRENAGDIGALRQEAHNLSVVMSEESVAASAAFTDKMDELQRQMKALRDQIGTALLPIFTNTLIPAIQDKVIPAFESLVKKVEGVMTFFADLPAPVQEAATVIGTALGAGGPIVLAVGILSKTLGALVAASGPVGLFIAAAALLTTAWTQWGDDIKGAVGPAVDWLTDKLGAIVDFLQSIIDKASAVASAIADALSFGNSEALSDPERLSRRGERSRKRKGKQNNAQGAIDGMHTVGVEMANGMAAGFVEGMQANQEQYLAQLEAVTATSKRVFKVQSPSRVFMGIGNNIGEGLALGIRQSQALTESAIRQTSAGAVGATDSMVSNVLGSMSQLFTESKGLAIAQALVNTWQGATEALKLPFPANLAAFAQTLATGMGAVASIRSTSEGSSGGAGGANAAAPQAAAPAPKPLQVTMEGVSSDHWYQGGQIHDLLDMLNDAAGERGMTITRLA